MITAADTLMRDVGVPLFESVGGTAWYEKLLYGSVVVIVFLLIIIALVLIHMAFHQR